MVSRQRRVRPLPRREWGVPVHDDRVLFEFLILEGAQAGLVLVDDPGEARELPPGVRRTSTRSAWRATARAKSRASWPMPASCATGSRSRPPSRMPGRRSRSSSGTAPSTLTSGDSSTVGRSSTAGAASGRSRRDRRVGCPVEGPPAERFPVRGDHYLLRFHAGGGHGNDHLVTCFRHRGWLATMIGGSVEL